MALTDAARDFPSIVPLLADKLDISLSAEIRGHPDFKIETDARYIYLLYNQVRYDFQLKIFIISRFLQPPQGALHLLSHLYVQRSSPVWKGHSSWLESTIRETFSKLPSSLPITDRRKAFLSQFEDNNVCFSLYRHILVLETSYRRLSSFIPSQVLGVKFYTCDPLPPRTTVNQYDQEFFKGVDDLYSPRIRSRRQRVNDERRLAQFIPDAAFRQQLQVMLIDSFYLLRTSLLICLYYLPRHFSKLILILQNVFRVGYFSLRRWRASYRRMFLKT